MFTKVTLIEGDKVHFKTNNQTVTWCLHKKPKSNKQSGPPLTRSEFRHQLLTVIPQDDPLRSRSAGITR